MRLSFRLAAVKTLRKKKKKKNVGGGRRRSIIKDYSKSAATCKDIPEEILIEILVRLPTYSLMRFKCVSKLWYSLISSRYFTNFFFNFSSSAKRERRVLVYTNKYKLFSSSLSNLDATDSLQLTRDLTFPCINKDRLKFVNSLRGLMCFRVNWDTEEYSEIQIINFTTRQVLRLPLVESNMSLECDEYFVWNQFGYDPVNDEYKVLCIISSVDGLKPETQVLVLVLGAGASWRNTKNHISPPHLHSPHGQGISINGFLYYAAWSHEERFVLISFDWNCEEFNLIEFSKESRIKWDVNGANLMNYKDQVALFDGSRLYSESILDLWVLEHAGESRWSHINFVVPYRKLSLELTLELVHGHELNIRGTGRRGEVALSRLYMNQNDKNTYVIYDLERNCIGREVAIEPPNHIFELSEADIWDDVESIMYLEA